MAIIKIIFLILLMIFANQCTKNDTLNSQRLIVDDSILKKEIFVGKMFFHDQPPGQSMDVFMADLYVILTDDQNLQSRDARPLHFGKAIRGMDYGPTRITEAEFQGRKLSGVSVNVLYPVDVAGYKFMVRNIENLTNSAAEDSSVNVNSKNWIVFISNRTGTYEIFFMDSATRITQQLTPINGQYPGPNYDPEWKADDIIIWSHQGRIIEVNIKNMAVNDNIIPEWDYLMYDPKYSPDLTKILFSAWVNGQKNGYEKNFVTGKINQVLPSPYASHVDDNPTWIFSNSKIAGHVFYPGNKGRIYIKNGEQSPNLITPSIKDFRYVTPVTVLGQLYLVFTDYSNGVNNLMLWIANENGGFLRPLNQGGDEAVFYALNLPPPRKKNDLKTLANKYVQGFTRENE